MRIFSCQTRTSFWTGQNSTYHSTPNEEPVIKCAGGSRPYYRSRPFWTSVLRSSGRSYFNAPPLPPTSRSTHAHTQLHSSTATASQPVRFNKTFAIVKARPFWKWIKFLSLQKKGILLDVFLSCWCAWLVKCRIICSLWREKSVCMWRDYVCVRVCALNFCQQFS